jgi:hypothetical protein
MLVENIDGIVWLLVLLGPLLICQRSLHREIQGVFLLLTRRAEISLALFSLLFFPGVLIHEASHYLMSRLLGVPTGRVSLLPRPMENGRLQLGYVETGRTDILRDALIGMAPLLAGGLCVALTGLRGLGLDGLWTALFGADQGASFREAVKIVTERPDFWLWFYLTFVVSSTMLPSASDRRAWLPLLLVFGLLLGIVLLAGAGPWLVEHLAPGLNLGLRALAAVFGVSVSVHILVLIPIWIIRTFISKVTRLKVV